MTIELREELVKFGFDLPAYGAIMLTKIADINTSSFSDLEKYMYNHGWLWLLVLRFGNVIWDLHHKLSKHVTIYQDGEPIKITGYRKIFIELKKLLK
jgi:hypothetical protein